MTASRSAICWRLGTLALWCASTALTIWLLRLGYHLLAASRTARMAGLAAVLCAAAWWLVASLKRRYSQGHAAPPLQDLSTGARALRRLKHGEDSGAVVELAVLYGIVGLCVGVTFTLLVIGLMHGGLQ